jgi:DNA-binding beta-propeller fold protein YncE
VLANGHYYVAFDGTNIWVANTGNNNTAKLRASDGQVLGTYQVGRNPYGVILDAASIWATKPSDRTVTRLWGQSQQLLVISGGWHHSTPAPWSP